MITIVAGLPRSGTSLMMRMLHMGGMEVRANMGRCSFEDDRTAKNPIRHDFMLSCDCRAVKLLDPQRFPLPVGLDYRVIFMNRCPDEQAKSIIKWVSLMGVNLDPDQGRLTRSIERDLLLAHEVLRSHHGLQIMDVRFEEVIHYPAATCCKIAAFLAPDTLDRAAMAACVVNRSAACLPGLLELSMTEAVRP